MARESAEAALVRWRKLERLQAAYPTFEPFLDDIMVELGFSLTPIQRAIGEFLQYGPAYLMVQAQRGQAKTTITAIFAVWCLIHNPQERILVISAGEKQANEISTLIVRMILNIDMLECMRPDATHGDKTSVEHFDIHHSLKGLEKSPSVACVGITANLQGKRASLLIADDVESKKNSKTASSRQDLLELTRDFTSICDTGRIIYLGTPQSQDSIYNTLPSRGFAVRIWPGRYPTEKQMEWYGEHLAPDIKRALAANPNLATGGGILGDQGQCTDPRLNEEVLSKKEQDQGTAYFQLQHMLSTALTDSLRYPLKTEMCLVMRLQPTALPMTVVRGMVGHNLREFSIHGHSFRMADAHSVSADTAAPDFLVMYVDPAGGGTNGDETGYAVIAGLNGNVFLLDAGGVPGGYGMEQMKLLAEVAQEWQVNEVCIEKNFGYGAFKEVWLPVLRKYHAVAQVTEDYVTGQKEIRIAETLEPVISRGSLIINESLIEKDVISTQGYAANKRLTYSLFFQISRLTRDRGALAHDDRLDAVEGAVRKYLQGLAQNQDDAVAEKRRVEAEAWMQDPLGHQRYGSPSTGGSLLNKYRR